MPVVHHLGRIPYPEALRRQEELVKSRLAGACPDHLLLLEHDPVFTMGRGASEADLQGAPERLGIAAHRVGRGGGVTYHAPGQLVAYPILALPPDRRDVRRYVGFLEQILIDVCRHFGVTARRRPGEVGVWAGPAKIGSVGVGFRRWVTFHGVALNVNLDPAPFSAIVTCRTPGLQVTSLAEIRREGGVDLREVEEVFVECFAELWCGRTHGRTWDDFGSATAAP